jgi:D-sedoheptulose 7-phosphate isomerase
VTPGDVRDALGAAARLLDAMAADEALCAATVAAAGVCVAALRAGGKLLLCGNGGSAAEAQHWAAELVSRFNHDRPGLAAIALTADGAILTGIGNDYGQARIFARQVEALGAAGDVLLALSTSGRSPNVLEALRSARARGMATIGFTGERGGQAGDAMAALCDICVAVPSAVTPRIQEGHAVLGHALCAAIEAALFPGPG